jgi:N-acyl-D-aspartate/D-glutamate deacylase
MSFDLLIRNGTVIDGTGLARYHADIAVQGAKIAEIGLLGAVQAKRVIDASDLVVAPGFVDPHAHFDAQICWDNDITPTSWHGVTTVVSGNCGVGIAPCRPESREIATRDLVGVEAIPYEALRAGISWDWETFPEYIAAANRRRPAINLGMLAPLTPFRHYVMGEQALERAADGDEARAIGTLIKEAVLAGAVGFSTTRFKQHNGYGGRPLACRQANLDEFRVYARALREAGQGTMQVALTEKVGVISDEELAFLDMMLDLSGRPMTWSAVVDRDDMPFLYRETLTKSAAVRERGAIPQIAALPITRDVSMTNPSFLGFTRTFGAVLGKSKQELGAHYADRDFRQSLREDLKNPLAFSGNWSSLRLTSAVNPALDRYIGMTIADIAQLRGVDGVDVLLDITLEDDFQNEFALVSFNGNDERLAEIIRSPGTLIGLADAGAHVDSVCDARQTTFVLGKWVRERGVLTLEEAVKKMTADPADIFGLKSRGRLMPGNAADIVIFDPATVDCAQKWEKRYDFPAGAKRLVITSKGIEYTVVNGAVAWEQNAVTGARSGRVVNC